MSKNQSRSRLPFRILAVVLGVALLAYLVVRTGPHVLGAQLKAVGWGLVLVILLGGFAHVLKAWAWRLTFLSDIRHISFRRTLGLRLISEAVGTFGLPGQVLGEATRVSLLHSTVPVADCISSVTLDRGLYTASSAILSVLGMFAALLLVSLSASWRRYALLFASALLIFVVLMALTMHRRWPVFSSATRSIRRAPWIGSWLHEKHSVISSVEQNLFSFYHDAPGAFWGSLSLNFVCQGLAVLEVYLLLHFMGVRIAFLGAFVLEALTKLINVVGAINPGNFGTYEGGNMMITKLFGTAGATGLTLGLCRRARGFFWAAIGALCLIVMSKPTEQRKRESQSGTLPPNDRDPLLTPGSVNQNQATRNSLAVIVLANDGRRSNQFISTLARVGTLPVMLRTVLAAQAQKAGRIVISVASSEASVIRQTLQQTGRLPESVDWLEHQTAIDLPYLVREVAATADRVVLLLGTRAYQPVLVKTACDWNETSGALALTTDDELVGVYALSQAAAGELANECREEISTLEGLHEWMKSRGLVNTNSVPGESWQDITTPADRIAAECKLDKWLVKPTDGVFACMNRRVSIPISRQLIKFPITPNMVTFFTLGVSVASALFFARGGYWTMLLGAVLSVWASILDGCDGEVARLKLQSSDFGCWLETICDYLYYVLIFAGMAVGLARSSGSKMYLGWGVLLLFGAGMSFLVVGTLRHRMSGKHPEKFLAVWQQKAEKRSSNPLLYLGRNTEFIIRRCFFPYAILAFALLNITKIAFIATALGANLVWVIALYSSFTFSSKRSVSASRNNTRIAVPGTAVQLQRGNLAAGD